MPPADAWWSPVPMTPDCEHLSGPGFSAPGVDFLNAPIFATFAAVAHRTPDALALHAAGRMITYSEMLKHAEAMAGLLADTTSAGAGIAVLLADEADVAVAFLACLAAGRICLLLNPENPPERVAAILATARPAAVLLAEGQAEPALPSDTKRVIMPRSLPEASSRSFQPCDIDAPAAVIYTSGSTGAPKGVVRSQRQLLSRAQHKILQFHAGSDDRILSIYPLTAGPGVTAMCTALLCGAAIHTGAMHGGGLRGVLGLLRDQRISIVTAVPVMLRTLLALPDAREAFACVKGVYSTSEATLRKDILAWRAVLPPGCAIVTGYGLTEGAPLADWLLPADLPEADTRLPIGYPTALHQYAITDADGVPVPDGVVGELWARGSLLSLGEWRAGRCVPGRLLADPTDPSRSVLRTGDLVCRQPDGLMTLIGRVDQMVKIRGNRIVPGMVQDALSRGPGVADAAVVVTRADTNADLIAYIVPARDSQIDRRGLIHELRQAMPSYMVPSRFTFLRSLPRLPNGKVDTVRLADPAFIPDQGMAWVPAVAAKPNTSSQAEMQ